MKTCCCCCGVRCGTLIIGYVGLVLEILSIISVPDDYDDVKKQLPDNSNIDDTTAERVVLAIYYSSLASFGLSLVVRIMMLYGTHTNKKFFLLPWLIIDGFINFVLLLFFLALIIGAFILFHPALGGILTAIALIILTVVFYCWACVLSFYKELDSGNFAYV